jgi:hypothetical protein
MIHTYDDENSKITLTHIFNRGIVSVEDGHCKWVRWDDKIHKELDTTKPKSLTHDELAEKLFNIAKASGFSIVGLELVVSNFALSELPSRIYKIYHPTDLHSMLTGNRL